MEARRVHVPAAALAGCVPHPPSIQTTQTARRQYIFITDKVYVLVKYNIGLKHSGIQNDKGTIKCSHPAMPFLIICTPRVVRPSAFEPRPSHEVVALVLHDECPHMRLGCNKTIPPLLLPISQLHRLLRCLLR